MTSPTLVSVVIPTRDRAELLRLAVSTALDQRGVEVELILVDDGSGAAAREAIIAVAGADERIRLLRHERSVGVALARNAGMAAAHGQWIAFLDDDDLWSPEKLARQLEAAGASGAGFVYASAINVDDALMPIGIDSAPPPEQLGALLRRGNAVPGGGSNMLVDAATLRATGGFDPAFGQLADWELWLRLEQGTRGAACPDVLVAYRTHESNWILRDPLGGLDEFKRMDDKHDMRSARRDFMHWTATGALQARRHGLAARLFMRAREPRAAAAAAIAAVRRDEIPQRAMSPSTCDEPRWLRDVRARGRR
jgi:glycosyltransferase involved in cell wall biosynthesis